MKLSIILALAVAALASGAANYYLWAPTSPDWMKFSISVAVMLAALAVGYWRLPK